MKIYETNSGLGWNQIAYLIESSEGYLVIDLSGVRDYDTHYVIGEIVEMEEYELEESNYNINNSPLKGKYLFEFYLQNFK